MTRARDLGDFIADGGISQLDVTGNATITVADNSDALTIVSTDADASFGPNLRLYRNSGSPADSDLLGNIEFEGRNDNSQDVVYGRLFSKISDASDGTEDGIMRFDIMKGGSLSDVLTFTPDELVVNDGSYDYNFRVESNNHDNLFFVDGGNDGIGIGNSTIIDWSTNYPGLQMGQAGALYGHKTSNQMNFAMNWGVTTGNVYITDGIASRMVMDTSKISFDTSASGSAGGSITGINTLQMTSSGSVFNEDGADLDFRVESNSNTHMLFVDGGNDGVGINATPTYAVLSVNGDGGAASTGTQAIYAEGAKSSFASASYKLWQNQLAINDTTSPTTGTGGSISFLGRSDTGSNNPTTGATVEAAKTNSTNTDYSFDAVHRIRHNGNATMQEHMRLSPTFNSWSVGGSEKLRVANTGAIGIGGATYGTSGQVLTSGGSGAAPTWADAASGGTAFSAF